MIRNLGKMFFLMKEKKTPTNSISSDFRRPTGGNGSNGDGREDGQRRGAEGAAARQRGQTAIVHETRAPQAAPILKNEKNDEDFKKIVNSHCLKVVKFF